MKFAIMHKLQTNAFFRACDRRQNGPSTHEKRPIATKNVPHGIPRCKQIHFLNMFECLRCGECIGKGLNLLIGSAIGAIISAGSAK
jgi:hypothetical protein